MLKPFFLRIYFILTLMLTLGLQLAAQQMTSQRENDTIDVVKYNLNLDVTDFATHVLHGIAGIEFTTPFENVSMLSLSLKQLQVDSVKTENGEVLNFNHQADVLHIPLPGSISTGDTMMVQIFYHGVPFHESWGGFHFSGAYAFNLGVGFVSIPHNLGKAWFPCVDDFVDRAFYDYHIRVENGKIAACGGILQSVSTLCDGTKEFFWKSQRSLPTYLASVTIGPYILIEDTFNGMEQSIPITYFVRPQDSARAVGSFVNMKNITGIYENCFGPYPFERIGISGTALGAMEHAENISYPNSSINGGLDDEWLYAHELSHMWFGNKVTCASDADMWLNEGWARWCETLYREQLYGIDEARDQMRGQMREVLRFAHISEGGYLPLSPMPSNLTYGTHVYDKGGIVVHALRGYLGDSLFFSGVKAYLDTFAYQPASSYQMRDFLTTFTGTDLTAFFDFHVFGPGYNHVSVDSFRVTPSGNGFNTEVFVRQKLKGATLLANDCRTELAFMSADRMVETRVITFSGSNGSASFQLPFEPLLVMADLYERCGDATTDQFKTIHETGEYDFADTYFKLNVNTIGDSAFARVTHHWVAPDSLQQAEPGLRLSDYRYWSVEGIFPEGFSASGKFTYNRGNALDNTLLTNQADSLVILYRPNAKSDWQPVTFSRSGPWHIGIISVPNLLPGDYTLAVWDEAWVGVHRPTGWNQPMLKVSPNPGKGIFQLERSFTGKGTLTITNAMGKVVKETSINNSQRRFQLDASDIQPGHYYLTISNPQQKESTTLLIIP